jgi:hypothetical protein
MYSGHLAHNKSLNGNKFSCRLLTIQNNNVEHFNNAEQQLLWKYRNEALHLNYKLN